jgi:hypothetical protein
MLEIIHIVSSDVNGKKRERPSLVTPDDDDHPFPGVIAIPRRVSKDALTLDVTTDKLFFLFALRQRQRGNQGEARKLSRHKTLSQPCRIGSKRFGRVKKHTFGASLIPATVNWFGISCFQSEPWYIEDWMTHMM